MPLLFDLVLIEVDPNMLFLILFVSKFQMYQRLFACKWHKHHLLELYDGVLFQMAHTMGVSLINFGTITRLVTISSTTKPERCSIRFPLLLFRLRLRKLGHILDLVQTYLVLSDDNSILKESYVLLLVSIGVPNASTAFQEWSLSIGVNILLFHSLLLV